MPTPLDQPISSIIARPPRLGDQVYDTIYAQLMDQKIPPDSRITIENLVRELGVSQTPIREALSRLEAQGLVTKVSRGGFSAARQMDRERFDNLYELRLLLEPGVARQAAIRLTDEQLVALKAIAAEMGAKIGQGGASYSEFARLDLQFHNLIAQAGGNRLIAETLANLHTHMHLFRLFHHEEAVSESHKEHEHLIKALEAREPDAASAAMHAHIDRAFERFSHFFS